jgi:hypothetical protein
MNRARSALVAVGLATLTLACASMDSRLVESAPNDDPAASLVAGTRVAALWKDGRYYPGTIAGVLSQGLEVAYDGGDRWVVPVATLVIISPGIIREGARVLAVWTDGRMYPGVIASRSPGGATIAWDDGGKPMFVPEGNIALLGP